MKARAKRIDNGKWIEGYYMRNSKESKDEAHVIWFEEEVRGVTEYDYEEIDPSTLVFPEVERLKAITKRKQMLLEQYAERLKKQNAELLEALLGNKKGSLDEFLLNSPYYIQEERELIMNAVSEWQEEGGEK